ncbi:MAG TPA: carboxypeptidase regulatory-like domain-containing protein [Vicinamibacterales bacterium]|jgi:hypothetical protein
MRLLLTIILAGLPVVLTASDYFGQVTFNGLPVPGATVTATHGDRTASATTNQDGIYHLADLVDGVWRVTVEMLGFEPVTHEIAVPAESDPPATTLTVRSLDQLSRGLESDTKRRNGIFPRTPLTRAASLELDESPSGSSGGPPVDLSVLVGPTGIGAADGLLINGSLNNGAATAFTLPRGIGNNRPRPPSVFTYAAGLQLGNSAWDARPFAATGSRPLKPSYTNTHALGTLEGPIRVPWLRNTITVALGYQGASTTGVNTQFTRVPTDRERLGDFGETLDAHGQPVRIVDPSTGQPFQANAIPAARISRQATALLAYYPHADPALGGRFNYQAPVVTASREDALRSRGTYTTVNQSRVTGGISYQRTTTDTTSLFGFDDTRASSIVDTQWSWMLRLSRNTTAEVRYQYVRAAADAVPYFANRVNVSGDAGITGNDQDPRNWGPPSLTFASDLASLTDGRYSSTVGQEHVWAASLSRFRGAHNLGFGGEIRQRFNDVFEQQDPRGSFAFTSAASGVDFADFLLGLPQTSAIAVGNAAKQFRGRAYAAYATDDWRMKPTLTLSLGVRWEYEAPITEASGRLANLDIAPGFTAVKPVIAGANGVLSGMRYSNALVRADMRGVQPRLGVAWRPSFGSSMVVRAGYGIYRNTNVYQPIASLLAAQPPFTTTFNISTDASRALTLADGFPVSGASFNTFAVDPNFRVASAHNWEASMQRDLHGALTLVVSYLGTRGTNLMQQFLPNTYPAGAANPCPTCPAGFRYLTSNGRSIRHAGQIQVRHRLSGGLASTTQYTLAKAMDDAAAFGGATLDGGALVQNWLDPDAEYARSNFDQRHLVTESIEYTSGSGTSGGTLRDGWKGRLVKDWTFTANFSAGSGLPLTPVYFAPIGGTGIIGSLRPDLTGVRNAPVAGSYADAGAFAPPASGTWGNAARNSITGPSTFTVNASVARTFRPSNRVNFDWRIEATNVLNRVTYASVNTLITSPQFGLATRANDMRKLRSSIRVRF